MKDKYAAGYVGKGRRKMVVYNGSVLAWYDTEAEAKAVLTKKGVHPVNMRVVPISTHLWLYPEDVLDAFEA